RRKNTIEVGETDDGTRNMSLTNSFIVTVREVNSAPVLTVPTNQVIDELTLLSVSASATDSDIPTNTLTFSLIAPPAGMSINPTKDRKSVVPGKSEGLSTHTSG